MIVPRRLRAPQQNGAVVAEPPLAEAGTLLTHNRQRLALALPDLLGRPWDDLRRRARQTALAAAREYLRRAGEPIPIHSDTSLLMAGHQPELFHPGVWAKNFALHGIAQACRAAPINLVVDNDTAKSTVLRFPVLASAETPWPHVMSVPFDHWSGEVPYEERTVHDESLFDSLVDRAALLLKQWSFDPLLAAFWAEVCKQAARTSLLGERLIAARRSFERRWGCHNLELPVSLLCQTEPFAWFACHLLTHLPGFHAIYNACLQEYRHRYGVRSHSHPVPDLAREGDWLEAPFWAWRIGQMQRRRLLVRRTASALELRVGDEVWPTLPPPLPSPDTGGGHGRGSDGSGLVKAWQDLEKQGFKVRSRALTNTLFARLFVADLFVHGIGGAKYDELTDEIIRRFYGCEPPAYLVLSATLLLPLPTFSARPETHQKLAAQLRDLRHNPQRHLANGALADPSVRDLVRQKQDWIARRPACPRERRERFQALRALTEQLRVYVTSRERALEQELTRCDHELQANAILQRRDYAFCLYPEELLRPFCRQFLR